MKIALIIIILMAPITMITLWYNCLQSQDLDQPSLGLIEFTTEDATRIVQGKARTLEVTLWYPTDQVTPQEKINAGIWKIEDVIRDAQIASRGQQLPLIIFSHGYSGNQWTNSWFAERLARQGYIVAIVRHYGNSHRNMIPEICVRPWNRPQDMSFVLDKILEHPSIGKYIDQNRIGSAGFSQGGMASIWLAGAQANLTPETLKHQITVLNDLAWRKRHFKDIPDHYLDAILDQFTDEDFTAANRSYYDKRFKAHFAIAPGIDAENIMFTAQGLSHIITPVHITIGQADNELIEQAYFFTQHIPTSSFTLIPGHVTHMTMLNEGTKSGILQKPMFVLDHPSINRNTIHNTVATQAIEFFNSHFLKKSMITFDYLKHTPEHIVTCAQWSFNEWGHHTPERPLQDFIESRKKYLNDTSLPLTILAFDGDRPIGMCSLAQNRSICPELSPWLAALYVIPEYRSRGIGRQLEERICTIARTMGHENIYCFTSDTTILPWYKKQGWNIVGTQQLHDHCATVMTKNIQSKN